MKQKSSPSAKRQDLRVSLWKDGAEKDYLVARLIASAFYGTPPNGMTVNHKNGNYLDNRADNLEWVTREENNRLGFENGLFDSFLKKTVLVSESGARIEFRSMSQASGFLGRNTGYISLRHSIGKTDATGVSGERYRIEVIE